MEPSYHILYKEGQGEVVEKKSRFIANIFPVNTEEEALERIGQIKKKHYDARHNCFAYVIGEKNEIMRCSDDGEPSGTAGRPMLEVLTGREVHNAVAIVTRYFGGTLLGTGGLVRAYTEAVQEGLEHCVVLACSTGFKLRIETDYNGRPLYLYYSPPEFYVTDNGRWMHRLCGSEDGVQRLHEICLDACEQELADTIYW